MVYTPAGDMRARLMIGQRKFVTTVSGLENFNLDLKLLSKAFGKKFATGASVSKLPNGGEEITVQGDVSEEIEEFLLEKYPVIPEVSQFFFTRSTR